MINFDFRRCGQVDPSTYSALSKKHPFNLPHRPNSLANTLGYYGVGPGPYFFLPLIGPTTLRNVLGTSIDRLILPTTIGSPFNTRYYAISTNVLSAIDYRVAADDKLTALHDAADPYAATRTEYLARRRAEIARLHSPKWNARHLLELPKPSFNGTPSTSATTTASEEPSPRVSDPRESLPRP